MTAKKKQRRKLQQNLWVLLIALFAFFDVRISCLNLATGEVTKHSALAEHSERHEDSSAGHEDDASSAAHVPDASFDAVVSHSDSNLDGFVQSCEMFTVSSLPSLPLKVGSPALVEMNRNQAGYPVFASIIYRVVILQV